VPNGPRDKERAVTVCPLTLLRHDEGGTMERTMQKPGRYVGLDIHKELAVSCIVDEAGKVVQRQRCGCTREALEQFGRRYLQPSDKVALEATTNTWEVVAILKPFVAEVVVSNPLKTKAIAEAKIKTDKVDAEV
jgi:transposase